MLYNPRHQCSIALGVNLAPFLRRRVTLTTVWLRALVTSRLTIEKQSGAVRRCAWDQSPGITLADLRQRWEWDPLRNDPRFQKILASHEPATSYK